MVTEKIAFNIKYEDLYENILDKIINIIYIGAHISFQYLKT